MAEISNHARREFIRRGGLLLTGSTTYSLLPNYAWAENDSRLETMAFVCHAMYPHKHVPFKHYKACAQGLLDKAAQDAKLSSLLGDGITRLNLVGSPSFGQLSENDRELALQREIGSEFFNTVRGHTVVGLYNIPGIWKYFGYQGPSFAFGGYLRRGLDDIFWLKDL